MNVVAPSNAQLTDQIAALTRELASLDRTKDDHLLELGRKLIPIRQLLQAVNGSRNQGPSGKDGLRPHGWHDWCSAAGIPHSTATLAINRAIDPEGHRQKMSKSALDRKRRPNGLILALRRASPNWTDEECNKVTAAWREILQERNRGT